MNFTSAISTATSPWRARLQLQATIAPRSQTRRHVRDPGCRPSGKISGALRHPHVRAGAPFRSRSNICRNRSGATVIPIWDLAADELERLAPQTEGDVLVFMPGKYEIGRTISAIRASRVSDRFVALPLHGELPPAEQDAALAHYQKRRAIVATNVAETSLTIDGVRVVIDSGLARIARFDPRRGINTLLVEKISRASADQRAGRAGRTAPGHCLRLWTEREHLDRAAQELPEVKRLDLAEVVLTLKASGVEEIGSFRWLEPPDPRALARAEQLLIDLGAFRHAESPERGASPLAKRPAANFSPNRQRGESSRWRGATASARRRAPRDHRSAAGCSRSRSIRVTRACFWRRRSNVACRGGRVDRRAHPGPQPSAPPRRQTDARRSRRCPRRRRGVRSLHPDARVSLRGKQPLRSAALCASRGQCRRRARGAQLTEQFLAIARDEGLDIARAARSSPARSNAVFSPAFPIRSRCGSTQERCVARSSMDAEACWRAKARSTRASARRFGNSRDRKQRQGAPGPAHPRHRRSKRNGCANFSRNLFGKRLGSISIRLCAASSVTDDAFSRSRPAERRIFSEKRSRPAAQILAREVLAGTCPLKKLGQRGRAMDRAGEFRRARISGVGIPADRRGGKRVLLSNRSARARRATRKSRSDRSGPVVKSWLSAAQQRRPRRTRAGANQVAQRPRPPRSSMTPTSRPPIAARIQDLYDMSARPAMGRGRVAVADPGAGAEPSSDPNHQRSGDFLARGLSKDQEGAAAQVSKARMALVRDSNTLPRTREKDRGEQRAEMRIEGRKMATMCELKA